MGGVCKSCERVIDGNPRLKHQEYCHREKCQRDRRARWQREKLKKDKTYRENHLDAEKRWRERHKDYWREYRRTHPEYLEKNREQQKERNARRGGERVHIAAKPEKMIANMDTLAGGATRGISGRYRLTPLDGPMIANMDSFEAEISFISTA